jgi:TonB family protein
LNHPHIEKFYFAVFLSVALHALGVLALVDGGLGNSKVEAARSEDRVIRLELMALSPAAAVESPAPDRPDPMRIRATASMAVLTPDTVLQTRRETAVASPAAEPAPTFMDAPPAPTAQEWAEAGQYTLKNSKRYRYTWGQQVRSMMGTAVEGPDQGMVRFRIEIDPGGKVARLETLWSTSAVAEHLARKAVERMPPPPPTPTGKSLVFETTISFQPFDSGGPPIYKYDCLPDPPAYGNPFVWDGQSPQVRVEQPQPEQQDPQALAECLKQLPQDTIEAESAHDQRQLEQWGSSKLGR